LPEIEKQFQREKNLEKTNKKYNKNIDETSKITANALKIKND
jgi:hypothetical protein